MSNGTTVAEQYPSYTTDPNEDMSHRVLLRTAQVVTGVLGPVVDFIAREPDVATPAEQGSSNRPPSQGEALAYGGAVTVVLYGAVQFVLSKARQRGGAES